MPRRALTCLALALASACLAWADADVARPSKAGPAAFAEGKKLVDEGKDARPAFRRAMHAFQQHGPDLQRTAWAQNSGNAAFLADDLPRAILAFRYGLSQDRHHAVLRENLAYARSQVRYITNGQRGRPEPEHWHVWLPRLRATWYVSVGAISYCLAWLALTCLWFRRSLWLAFMTGAGFALASGTAYGCYWIHRQHQRDVDFPPAIIQLDDVPLRTGNGHNYPRHADLPTLSPGMEARRLVIRGDWWQIQFASGEIGWVPARAALSWEDLRR